MQEGLGQYGGTSMTRTFAIFAALAVAAVLVFVALGRNGVIDMNKQDALAIPSGAIPHGGREKPISELTTGSAHQ
jgi:hypothetical protein